MYKDDKIARTIGIEEHEYFLENLVKEDEIEEKITKFTEDTKKNILWCLIYTINII